MKESRIIRFQDMGLVSLPMNPTNPRTKFDEMLIGSLPAGEVFQFALFNKDNTRFRLIEDIVNKRNIVYNVDDIPEFTYYLEHRRFWKFSEFEYNTTRTPFIESDGYYMYSKFCNGAKAILFLKTKPCSNDTFLSLDLLKKNNNKYVGNQIRLYNKYTSQKKHKVLELNEF